MYRKIRRAVRKAAFRLKGGTRFRQRHYSPELANALAGYNPSSDISDHLGTLFFTACQARPALIVELGTRGGESTRALLAAAQVCDATLLSIDVSDLKSLDLPYRDRWCFIQHDDVEFGVQRFAQWCEARSLMPQSRFIFIDTSHLYEHTKREIAAWIPHLAPGGVMAFHDTHMGKGLFARLDGSIGLGWDNDRGVIRAIEEFLGRSYDEGSFFVDHVGDFLVKHYPNSSGFTILQRLERSPSTVEA